MPEKVIIAGSVEGVKKSDIKGILPKKYVMPNCFSTSINLLVTANKANKDTIQKAKTAGIKIMSWEEFVKTEKLEDKVAKLKGKILIIPLP